MKSNEKAIQTMTIQFEMASEWTSTSKIRVNKS